MYIGPWQEFKLARLIQQQQQQSDTPVVAARAPKLQGRRRPGVPRRPASEADGDDIASVASSSRSGFSTQSAPAHLQQGSAQGRLNDYYDSVERSCRRGASLDAERSGSRPSSGVGVRPSASLRSLQQSRTGGGAAGAKKKASIKPKPPNPEQQRRERIRAMQKLYGLAKDEGDDEGSTAVPTPCSGSEASIPAGIANGRPAVELLPPPPVQVSPDVDRALHALQATMCARETAPVPQVVSGATLDASEAATGVPISGERDVSAWPLPSLPEDPLNQSTFSMASSGGLIAWSKALQRDEEAEPPATLASLFKL